MRIEELRQKVLELQKLEREVLDGVHELYPYEKDVDQVLNEEYKIEGQFPKDISLKESILYHEGGVTTGDDPLWGLLREIYDGKMSVATMASKLVEVHPDDW